MCHALTHQSLSNCVTNTNSLAHVNCTLPSSCSIFLRPSPLFFSGLEALLCSLIRCRLASLLGFAPLLSLIRPHSVGAPRRQLIHHQSTFLQQGTQFLLGARRYCICSKCIRTPFPSGEFLHLLFIRAQITIYRVL